MSDDRKISLRRDVPSYPKVTDDVIATSMLHVSVRFSTCISVMFFFFCDDTNNMIIVNVVSIVNDGHTMCTT